MSLEIKEKVTIHREKVFSVNGIDVVTVSADINMDAPCTVEGLNPYVQNYDLYEQHQDEIIPKLVEFNKTVFADKNRLKGEQQNENK